jgi:hypothetical protein
MFILLDTVYIITDVWDIVRSVTISKSWENMFLGIEEENSCIEDWIYCAWKIYKCNRMPKYNIARRRILGASSVTK